MAKKNGNKDIIIKAFEENGFTIPADKTDDFITAIVYEFESIRKLNLRLHNYTTI